MITIELPYPPSLNSLYRIARLGKRSGIFKSSQGKDYTRTVQALCYGKKMFRKEIKLKVLVEVHPPDKRKRDLMNIEKILCDSLEGALYQDDNQICDIRFVRKEIIKPAGMVRVFIEPMERLSGKSDAHS